MNERIYSITAMLNTPGRLQPELIRKKVQEDMDWKAAYCLREDLLKIYVEHDLSDLTVLGKQNLQLSISAWRYQLRGVVKELKWYENLIKFLEEHDTIESLEQYAQKFRGVDPGCIVRYDPTIQAYEPVDAKTLERQANTSTLKVCGWCKYCHGVWGKCDCNLTCECRLLDRTTEKSTGKKLSFATPCAFLKEVRQNSKLIAARLTKLRCEKEELLKEKKQYLERINTLTKLRETAEDKPAFPCCSLSAKFKDGERVIVMTNEPEKQNPETGAMPLYRGTVIPSKYQYHSFTNRPRLVYTDHDSFMAHMLASVQMSNYPAIQLDEQAGWDEPYYAVGSALSISEKDFEYLCTHEEYRKLWLAGLGENTPWVRATWIDAFGKNTLETDAK